MRPLACLALIGGIVIPALVSACRTGAPPDRGGDAAIQGGTQPYFVGTTWVSTDPSAAPGTLRIFLADGTLVMDSCGETYRLARWQVVDERRIAWEEDGARIDADVAQPTPDTFRLQLHLVDGIKQETYRRATVPFVCPDSRPNPAASVTP
jgi:hypothetical protein